MQTNEGMAMRLSEGSARTKLIYGVFIGLFAIGLALILALLIGLTGLWFDEQVPEISVWIFYVGIAMVVLRLTLGWSVRADRRNLPIP